MRFLSLLVLLLLMALTSAQPQQGIITLPVPNSDDLRLIAIGKKLASIEARVTNLEAGARYNGQIPQLADGLEATKQLLQDQVIVLKDGVAKNGYDVQDLKAAIRVYSDRLNDMQAELQQLHEDVQRCSSTAPARP